MIVSLSSAPAATIFEDQNHKQVQHDANMSRCLYVLHKCINIYEKYSDSPVPYSPIKFYAYDRTPFQN